jgi:protease I
MPLTGKTVYIFAEEQYQEMEIWVPLYRLREEGADVKVVGSAQQHKSKLGYPVSVDLNVADAVGSACDALIVPGGWAPDFMRRTPDFVRVTKEAAAAGKVIGAICHGGWILASADIVRGRTLTSFIAIRDDLVNAGATWVDQETVVDGNLVTARKPDDLPAFCKALVGTLGG